MNTLTEAVHSGNVEMILAMCELDMSTLNSSPDGMKVLMEALIKKYSKK